MTDPTPAAPDAVPEAVLTALRAYDRAMSAHYEGHISWPEVDGTRWDVNHAICKALREATETRDQEIARHMRKNAALMDSCDAKDAEIERLTAELAAAQADLRIPGTWECPTCGYVEVKNVLHVPSGAVTVNPEPALSCPNDGAFMMQQTWKQRTIDIEQGWRALLEEREAAQADTARLDFLERTSANLFSWRTERVTGPARFSYCNGYQGATPRAAIDAARAAGEREG